MESTLFTTLTVTEEASLSGGHKKSVKVTPPTPPSINTIVQISSQIGVIVGGTNNKIKQVNDQTAAIVGSKGSTNTIKQVSEQVAAIG